MRPVEARPQPQGLSSARGRPAARSASGRPRTESSRSVASIVAATSSRSSTRSSASSSSSSSARACSPTRSSALIAIVNSAIGIRQEMKAKETLDQLALLVAPRAQVDPRRRDGRAARRRGRARRRRPGRARRPARRRRRRRRLARADDRRVAADRRVRRDPQAPRRPAALGLVLRSRAPGYYEVDAVREDSLRREDRRRGAGVPPPALAASARGQPGALGDDDRCWCRWRS